MKKVFFSGVIILSFFFLKSQPSQILYCKGNIPSEILSLATFKYSSDVGKIGKGKNKKTKKDFYLQSNFSVDDLLKSGQILFGDEMSNYVSAVGNEVLKSNPELQQKIKIFVVKSSDVNAFSSQQGYIFINIGLLAQLENEAQLAYLIAHEVTHFKYNHSINQFVNTDRLIKGKGKYRSLGIEEKKNVYYNYSKEDEFAADKLGLTEIFLKSNYNIEDASNLFDILLFSDLPFDELDFDTTYFDTPIFKLDSKYILPSTAAITTIDNYNDESKTHPNIKKRKEQFIENSLEYSNKDRLTFIVSKDDFLSMRNKAREELISLYIIEGQISKALYSTYLLQKKNIKDEFLSYAANYCLYAASKTKTYSTAKDSEPKYEEIEGKSQQVYFMLSKADDQDLCILAANKIWQEPKTANYVKYFNYMIESLITDMVVKYNISSIEIIKKNEALLDTAFKELSKEDYDLLTKFDKMKYDKKLKLFKESLNSKSSITLLMALIKDNNFLEIFRSVEAKYQTMPSTNTDDLTNREERILARTKRRAEKNKIKEPIKSLCVVNPNYEYYPSNSDEVDLKSSEKGKVRLISNISNSSKASSINANFLDAYYFHNEDVEEYNNLNIVVSWSRELGAQLKNKIYNEDSNQVRMMLFTQPLIDEYLNKSNTENILYSSVYSYGGDAYDKVPLKLLRLWLSIPLMAVYNLLPVTIYNAIKSTKQTQIYNICVNAKKGSIISMNNVEIISNDYNFLIKSQYYDYFQHLKLGKY